MTRILEVRHRSRMQKAIVVFVTAGSEALAVALARALVGEGLAACVNLLSPIRSIYRWQGKIHDDSEVLLLAKTQASKFDALEARIRELHTYETPEIVALPIDAASAPYLEWLVATTASPTEDQ